MYIYIYIYKHIHIQAQQKIFRVTQRILDTQISKEREKNKITFLPLDFILRENITNKDLKEKELHQVNALIKSFQAQLKKQTERKSINPV